MKNWDEFVKDTKWRYMGIALNILRNFEASQDVVQDAYLRLYERDYDYDYEILKIIGAATVKRLCINIVRDRNRNLNKAAVFGTWDISEYDDNLTMPELFDPDTLPKVLKKILGGLHRDSHFILLAYAVGYSYKEIAYIFDIPVGTVKNKIHIARQELHEAFPDILIRD
jgi:RNA polymerase sigma-70 factor (ECF subfamily)